MTTLQEIFRKNTGRFLFAGLVGIILITAFIAFTVTGPVGIEERFSSALGIAAHDAGTHDDHDAAPGFSLEGQPLLYAVFLAGLCGICWIAYRKFGA
jgi:hypothetical protein